MKLNTSASLIVASFLTLAMFSTACPAQTADLAVTEFLLHEANLKREVSDDSQTAIEDAYQDAVEDMAKAGVTKGRKWNLNKDFEVTSIYAFEVSSAIATQLVLDSYDLGENAYLFIATENPNVYQLMTQQDLKNYGGKSGHLPARRLVISLLKVDGEKAPKIVLDKIRVFTKPEMSLLQVDNPASIDEIRRKVPNDLQSATMSFSSSLLCGVDNRIPCNDKRIGRTIGRNGTGFLIQEGLALTAGHVATSEMDAIQFGVPDSNSNQTINFDPKHEYPIDTTTIVRVYQPGLGYGRDWAVFEVRRNSYFPDLPGASRGVFRLSKEQQIQQVRVSGYGADDSPPERHRTLQTENGNGNSQPTFTAANSGGNGPFFEYKVDTQPYNSGSPVIDESNERKDAPVVAIHTNYGCPDHKSIGTAVTNRKLQDAIEDFVGDLSQVFVDESHD